MGGDVLTELMFQATIDSVYKETVSKRAHNLGVQELSNLYVDAAFLHAFLDFLKEQHWLQKSKNPAGEINYEKFLSPFLNYEFSQRKCLHEFIEKLSFESIAIASKKSLLISNLALEQIKTRDLISKKLFLECTLVLISELFEFENRIMNEKKQQNLSQEFSLFRIYDNLDEVLGLNYQADQNMKTNLNNSERLYEGAGVGVQSGYSTVLMALRYLNPSPDSRFIDLGSGYGRIGLVTGLMRPDVDFIGYEFVHHRVESSNVSAENLGLQKHVHFYTQDLSSKEFNIPEAEIYYLYDPFSDETYNHVLKQLIQISKHKKISIVTKGNARKWMTEVACKEGWPAPEEFHTGNLCLFHST